jgi:hypothetical protein
MKKHYDFSQAPRRSVIPETKDLRPLQLRNPKPPISDGTLKNEPLTQAEGAVEGNHQPVRPPEDELFDIITKSLEHLPPEEQARRWDALEKRIQAYRNSIAASSSSSSPMR